MSCTHQSYSDSHAPPPKIDYSILQNRCRVRTCAFCARTPCQVFAPSRSTPCSTALLTRSACTEKYDPLLGILLALTKIASRNTTVRCCSKIVQLGKTGRSVIQLDDSKLDSFQKRRRSRLHLLHTTVLLHLIKERFLYMSSRIYEA
jgi:hypothetical protein